MYLYVHNYPFVYVHAYFGSLNMCYILYTYNQLALVDV